MPGISFLKLFPKLFNHLTTIIVRNKLTNTATTYSGFKMKICALLFASIVLSSCLHKREQLLHEKGIVVEKHYTAGIDQYGDAYSMSSEEKDKDKDEDETETESKSKYTIHELHQPAKYMVIFRCEHNTAFAIDRLSLYGKLNGGDSVDLDYYEWVDKENKVQHYELVDANPIKKVN